MCNLRDLHHLRMSFVSIFSAVIFVRVLSEKTSKTGYPQITQITQITEEITQAKRGRLLK